MTGTMDRACPADVSIFHARDILTMHRQRPRATHVAVRAGRIVAVGGPAEMAGFAGARQVELPAGAVLMPGLVEGHSHLMEGAMWDAVYVGFYDRRGPDGTLHRGLTSLEQVVQRLRDAEARLEDPAEPLLAWGFDPILFGEQRLDAAGLDRVSRKRPVVVLHASVHLMNVNSAMLELAGIDEDTEIDGIDRDAQGRPSGELREFAAMFPVYRVIGRRLSIAASESPQAILNFASVARLAGVTTATDLVNDLSASGNAHLAELTARDDFPLRIVPAFAPQREPAGGAQRVLDAMRGNTEKLRYGPIKFIVDGSIQGFTARLRAPGYHGGQPNGLWLVAPSELEAAFTPYHRAGLQLHIHTNGDEATECVLDAIEAMLQRHPRADHRHTLQHCQLADEVQLRRAARLGMCVNFFANHLYYWGDAHWERTVGPQWASRMNPVGTALRLGITVGVHSDAPITPLAPLFTAWCAMQRESASGRTLGEGERIGLDDALHAITLGAARTLKLDHEIGSIEPGKLADFAVLLQHPHEQASLRDVEVWGTVVGGRVFPARGA